VKRKPAVHVKRPARVTLPEEDEPAPPTAGERGYDAYSLIFGYDLRNEPVER
jgi:hypothetical protein